jgi:hypothetical protein
MAVKVEVYPAGFDVQEYVKGGSPNGLGFAVRVVEEPIQIAGLVAAMVTVGKSNVIPAKISVGEIMLFAEIVFVEGFVLPIFTHGKLPIQLPIAISDSIPE